jgi:hypothetical protein
MARGSCLCGAVSWAVDGPLELPGACHCTTCRKSHGTAYGAYAVVPASALRWLGGQEHLQSYASSENGRRWFCGRCGSVAPGSEPRDRIEIPLGALEDAPPDLSIGAHIFTRTRVPWSEISDGAPQYAAWPPGFDLPAFPTPERASAGPDRIAGSCLCGQITYDVARPLTGMRHCHCSRCRRARAAPHASNAFGPIAGFRFTSGESLLRTWKLPEARFFAQSFCSHCGAPMPRVSLEHDLVVIPAGSFDDDPGVRPTEHIFVGSKASWFAIRDDLPQRHERT